MDPATWAMVGKSAVDVGTTAANMFGLGHRGQLRRQGELDEQSAGIQYRYGQMSADAAQLRNIEMLNYIKNLNSPAEKLKALKEAGLSPSMLENAGFGGQGGTPTANAQMPNIHGGRADSPIDIAEQFGRMSDRIGQSLLLDKQLEKDEIDIRKGEIDIETKLEELEDKRGIDRELKGENLRSLKQDVKNKELVEQVTKIEIEHKNIDLEIKEATKDWQIQKVWSDLENQVTQGKKLIEELDKLRRENKMEEELYDTKVNIVKQSYLNLITENVYKQAQIKNLNSQNDLMEIEKGLKELKLYFMEDSKRTLNENPYRWGRKDLQERMKKGGIERFVAGFKLSAMGIMEKLSRGNIPNINF